MLDPIGIAEKLKSNFLDYLDTAFTIQNKALINERRDELSNTNCFWQEPLIEIAQNYKSSGNKLKDLKDLYEKNGYTNEQFDFIEELLSEGLVPYELYEHQVEMFKTYLSGKIQ